MPPRVDAVRVLVDLLPLLARPERARHLVLGVRVRVVHHHSRVGHHAAVLVDAGFRPLEPLVHFVFALVAVRPLGRRASSRHVRHIVCFGIVQPSP